MSMRSFAVSVASVAAIALSACVSTAVPAGTPDTRTISEARKPVPVADRNAILAMAGDYKVTFDFTETISFVDGYELKPPKLSGGYEVVRVIEDRGDFISLQHILVVGGDEKFPIKHWRQDWQFEPERILTFVGGNAWAWRDVPEAERAGKWSQTVYQVDDAPRYSGLAKWTYAEGLTEWSPPHEWRPLPRRDQTTRDDYHAINAVNRHVITPWGWVHEQDNDKLVLSDEPRVLAREVGVNTYRRDSSFDARVAEEYWTKTAPFWSVVRAKWAERAAATPSFSINLYGETEEIYMPLLEIADRFAKAELNLEAAESEAEQQFAKFISISPPPLPVRLSLPKDEIPQ